MLVSTAVVVDVFEKCCGRRRNNNNKFTLRSAVSRDLRVLRLIEWGLRMDSHSQSGVRNRVFCLLRLTRWARSGMSMSRTDWSFQIDGSVKM